MLKTTEYSIFNFREDNREKIDVTHINRLIESIKARNLLEMRPITVNQDMEVLDGQHRLMAAKKLGVPIYYKIETELKAEDIITLNVTKHWTMGDYLNYYCKNGYVEYQKLLAFMTKNQLPLRVAFNITQGKMKAAFNDYKTGKYVFNEEAAEVDLDVCWQTIYYVHKMNGYSAYTNSSRFWTAILKLVKNPDFNFEKWSFNLKKMVERIGHRAAVKDYLKTFQEIYNWRNAEKIKLLED